MKLYFAPGTCSLSPHIVLQELGLPYDLVRVNNRTKRMSDGGDFRTVNPKGYVAALMLDDGAVLTEGPAIVQFLADLKPDSGLAPASGTRERVRLQEWLNFITAELHAGAAPLFRRDFPSAVHDDVRDRLRRRIEFTASALSGRDYLSGAGFTVADAYLFTVLGWMEGFSINLAQWPAVVDFIARVARRPSVTAALLREAAIPPVEM